MSLGVLSGCEPVESGNPDESIGEVAQEISNPCNASTFNAPCDPDGNGALSECEGVCRFAGGTMTCQTVTSLGMASSDLNGRLCGTGVANDCSKNGTTCSNGACLDTNGANTAVPDGTACQHSSQEVYCSGQCLAGTCALLTPACTYGVDPDPGACGWNTCDPLAAS
ncbi:MAG TPA: hypothetical protein VL400_17165, partial [Polyangiaceae bacterium]|nr:hypothetical protein [Polyangiaceae bacterium]